MRTQNQRHKVHHVVGWVALLSALSHIFCCGLPMLMGILSLLAGFGTFSTLFPGFDALHARFQDYEPLLIVFSVLMLMLGWGMQFYAARHDCHDTGCHHPPCAPKKHNATLLLWAATGIFVLNTGLLLFVHKPHVPYPVAAVVSAP